MRQFQFSDVVFLIGDKNRIKKIKLARRFLCIIVAVWCCFVAKLVKLPKVREEEDEEEGNVSYFYRGFFLVLPIYILEI